MNGGAGRRVYGFSSTERTAKRRPSSRVGEPARVLLVELPGVRLQLPVRAEVAALRDPLAVERDEPRRERPGIEGALDVPVRGGDERHPLALALDDEPRRDRLDAAGRQPRHHLLPEHRRDLVAVEAVEDPPRLLRVDERARRPVAGVSSAVLDRLLRDLVEDHPARRAPSASAPGAGARRSPRPRGPRPSRAGARRRPSACSSASATTASCPGRRRSTARSRRRSRRRARRSAPAPPSGSRRRAPAGRGCDRCSTRPRSRARGSRRSSSPSRATRR